MNKLGLQLALVISASFSIAQHDPMGLPPNPRSGGAITPPIVLPANIPTKKVIPYAHLTERDYVWSKMVWRTIDLRQKLNYPLYYPLQKNNWNWSLWDVLSEGILAENITAFKPLDEEKFIINQTVDGDAFRYPILPLGHGSISDSLYDLEITKLLNDVTEVQIPAEPIEIDSLTGIPIYAPDDLTPQGHPKLKPVLEKTPIRAQDIIEYRLKEEWFFDKQRGVMDVRIIGIAPVRYIIENQQVIGKREVFWVYFPEARYLLQNFHVFNPQNKAQRVSFDDLFWKRNFQSYVDKEDNVYNRQISDHLVGRDALLEAEEIKSSINSFEHDLWHF